MKKILTIALSVVLGATFATAQEPDLRFGNGQWSLADDFGCFFQMMNSNNAANAASPKDKKPKADKNKSQSSAKGTATGKGSATPKVPVFNDKDAMIKVSKEEDDWFFEIADTIIGRDILAVSRFTSTPAGCGSYGGENFSTKTFYFEKNTTKKEISLRDKAIYMYADTLDAVSKAVKASSMDPIIATFHIESNKNGRIKVKATDFVLSDNALSLPSAVKTGFGITGLNMGCSYVESIHSYPINTEISTVRTYNMNPKSETPTVTFGLNTSLLLLPKEPMRPRICDPRVGFFSDNYYVFSDNQQQVDLQVFACRRRLEPKNEEDAQRQRNGELIEPKKQIVYYIDPATPKQWRPYLIQGVKDWNAAFEQAGWKNAITAMECPEDSTISMEDARYSFIMYLASDIANAYGPQNHDPRSGEILESHVGWYHNVMSLVHNWYQVQCGAIDPEARNAKYSTELMGQLIRFVSSHEIGHTLGLRHNFGASATVPVDSLRSNEYLAKNGFCPSIMDYARFNYVAQPEDNIEVKNLFPRINDYDKWAIEWAYKPIYDATDAESERYILNHITTEKTNQSKRLMWYDGEDLRGDPRRQTEDLGDDAVKANSLGIENLKRIIPNLREWNYWGNDNYDEKLPEMYNQVVGQFNRYCMHVFNNLSGFYNTPLAPEQEGLVYQFPPKEKAESVIPFFEKNIINAPRWLVDVPYADRIFLDKDDVLENISSRYMRQLSSSSTIYSINPRYGSAQYLEDLVKATFKEGTSAPLDRYHRNLQSILVDGLCKAYKSNRNDASDDVLAAIYTTLKDMDKKFRNVSNSDKLTELHYQQMADKIQRALNGNDSPQPAVPGFITITF